LGEAKHVYQKNGNFTTSRVKHALGVIDAKFQTDDEQQDAHECLITILGGPWGRSRVATTSSKDEDELFGFIVQAGRLAA
jgi:hypothetical protein